MPTLGELAAIAGGRIIGDASIRIERVAAVDEADEHSLTFATDERYFEKALSSNAAAVLVQNALLAENPVGKKPLIAVEDARRALAEVLKVFERKLPRGPFVHPSAVIDPSAKIGAQVYVGALVCIGERAVIGDRTTLQAGAIVAADASVGEDCLLHPHATVLEGSLLGNRVVIHSGAVVGSEGFGWAFIEGRLQKIPQVGNAVLADDVEIGANSCVDRGQTGSTSIGRGTKIDNLVQIGHNCRIGEHCAFAALVGLAGTTIIGDNVQFGGQSGSKGHVTIGSRVIVAGKTGIWSDIPEDSFVSGNPARPHKEELRREVMVRKLPKLFSRVDALESRLRNAEHSAEPE